MKTRTKLIIVPATLLLMLAGCAMLRGQADDPNSPLSKGVGGLGNIGKGLQDGASAAGPYGWIAAAIGTVLTGAAGAYKVRQKNQTIKTDGQIITAQQKEFLAVRDTTKAIVSAIEDIGGISIPEGQPGTGGGGTIGDAVKKQVAVELKKQGLDTIGKAIITGVKAARANEAQKMQ